MGETKKSAIITLTTDFGIRDAFVGVVKGVILSINEKATIIDITHGIPQGDLDAASFALDQTVPFFPAGAIHVIIVDPGVGTARRIILVKTTNNYFLAPDNSVLKYIYDKYPQVQVVSVTNRDYFLPHSSQTFHGRDIFAPVAAHLSLGVPFTEFGSPIKDFVKGDIALPAKSDQKIVGQIVYIDHFGNCISNISKRDFDPARLSEINIKDFQFEKLSHSYAEHHVAEPLAIISSHDHLEIAVRDGNAAQFLNIKKGEPVEIVLKQIS